MTKYMMPISAVALSSATSTRHRSSTQFRSVNSSPSPFSPLTSVDGSVDIQSDSDIEQFNHNDNDDDDDDGEVTFDSNDDGDEVCDDGVMDDVDQVDGSGHVLNDGEELLDQPQPMTLTLNNKIGSKAVFEEKTQMNVPSSASLLPRGELLDDPLSSSSSSSRRPIYLCPSKYGRPSTIFFDYPLAFGIQRQQEKILCTKPCTLRYKHADSACIYNSVTGTLKRAGFIEQTGTSKRDSAQWNVRWGKHMIPDEFKELKHHQRVNHFPGTGGIGRKDRLARNIAKSRRKFGASEYNFLPETYLLPADRTLWEMKFNNEPPGTLWICQLAYKGVGLEDQHCKPNSSSCGRGIKMVSKLSDIPLKRSCIVSRYVANPLLVNGRKFDLRIYVLCTSFQPLKIYVYHNGLARFCTEPYDLSKKNLKKKYIHLTNFSVNKKSSNFIKNTNDTNLLSGDDGGDSSKWSLVAFKKWLRQHYGWDRCEEVWRQVNDIFVKTLLSIETNVSSHISRLGSHSAQCWETFGFDILLSDDLKPYLMEVNCAPSLSSSSPLDKRIKNELLTDVFHTIGVRPAYVKEKESTTKSKEKSSSRTQSSSSAPSPSIVQTASSSARVSSATVNHAHAREKPIVHGSTMGPSNSRSSRAHSANIAHHHHQHHPSTSPISTSSSYPSTVSSAPSDPSASPSSLPSSSSSIGGRLGKLRSTPVHIFFSSLSKHDLSLLREYRDELDRAESGGFRAIFPVAPTSTELLREQLKAGTTVNAPTFVQASFDQYAHLFEVEKYETLLLMKFAKHFTPHIQDRICRGGRVEADEVIGAVSVPSSFNSSTSSISLQTRTLSAGSTSTPASTATPTSPPPSSVSPLKCAKASTSTSSIQRHQMSLNNGSLTHSGMNYSPPSQVEHDLNARFNDLSFHSHLQSRHFHHTSSQSQSDLNNENDSSSSPTTTSVPSIPVPGDASPFDINTDRYFEEQGVALQPYLPTSHQYDQGWAQQKVMTQQSHPPQSPSSTLHRRVIEDVHLQRNPNSHDPLITLFGQSSTTTSTSTHDSSSFIPTQQRVHSAHHLNPRLRSASNSHAVTGNTQSYAHPRRASGGAIHTTDQPVAVALTNHRPSSSAWIGPYGTAKPQHHHRAALIDEASLVASIPSVSSSSSAGYFTQYTRSSSSSRSPLGMSGIGLAGRSFHLNGVSGGVAPGMSQTQSQSQSYSQGRSYPHAHAGLNGSLHDGIFTFGPTQPIVASSRTSYNRGLAKPPTSTRRMGW